MNGHYLWSQLAGVLRMATAHRDWKDALDRTLDGAFRSLFALPLSAPFVIVTVLAVRRIFFAAEQRDGLVAAPAFVDLTVSLIAFIMDWGTGLAALLLLARLLGAARNAGDAVVGYNWAQGLVVLAQAAGLGLSALIGDLAVAETAQLGVLVFSIWLLWGVVRRGLAVEVGPAVAVVAALTLLSFVVVDAAETMGLALYKLFS